MAFRLLGVSLLLAFMAGCSNYQYKNYTGTIESPALQVLDLSNGTADAPIVYFDTLQYRDLGVPYHRLLLAIRVDGKSLPGAGRRSLLDFSGYQAVRLTPGIHSLEWCWVSMNKLGTGGGKCGFGANQLSLEAGKRYLATWSDTTSFKGAPTRQQMEIRIASSVIDLETKLQVYP